MTDGARFVQEFRMDLAFAESIGFAQTDVTYTVEREGRQYLGCTARREGDQIIITLSEEWIEAPPREVSIPIHINFPKG